MTPEMVGYGLLGLLLLVLAIVIVKKFGKMIASILTVIGAAVVAVAGIWLYRLITGGVDPGRVRTILEVLK